MAKGFKTGGGSRKGKLNKPNAELKEMILGALDKAGGVDYLYKRAKANPAAFMALIGRVLPMCVTGPDNGPIVIRWKD